MVIKVKNLIKKFEEKVVLDNFNLELKENDILGLIGPNGCGKTTLISCILELIHYDSGNILVFGENSIKNKYDIKRKIGFVPQEIAVFDELTVRENIDFFCSLYVSNKNERKNLVNYAIDFVDLKKFEKFIPKKLSGGLLRRLNIACGIVNKPKLLILDEPTVAIDTQSRNFILEKIKLLNEQGTSILYTTHYLEEAEYLCKNISIMDNGKNIVTGDMKELIENVSIKEKIFVSGIFKQSFIDFLKEEENIIFVEEKDGSLILNYNTNVGNLKNLVHLLDKYNVAYDSIFSKRPSLQDVYLELTGKEM
ncbi:putative ABC transporter, ATP-binding protein SagG [Tissierellia bacterium KA00581]|jgi:hypothetical protein|nr:putative ABC transporter, ATP-binding protein SagG [Tissierellia bacterium KA00581]